MRRRQMHVPAVLVAAFSSLLLLLSSLSSSRLPCAEAWIPPHCATGNGRGSVLPGKGRRGRSPGVTMAATAASSSSWSDSKVASSFTSSAAKIGDVVTMEARLVPQDDFVPEPLFDGVVPEDEPAPVPLVFVLGEGHLLPGLHELVLGMSVGEQVQGIPMDAGWGQRREDLVMTLPLEKLGTSPLDVTKLQPGVQLMLQNGLKCTVTEVTDEALTLDANPPLAGASYRADVKLLEAQTGPTVEAYSEEDKDQTNQSRYQVATFALGCFWGGELELMREPGVVGTSVGYTQGSVENPSYEQVCSGTTGHTEAIAVKFDPDAVSYEQLVRLAMDRLGENKYLPNQVGNDVGTQYRHGVYYHTPQQKEIAQSIVGAFGEDCVTEVLPAATFYKAEDYHQQYLFKGGQSARKGEQSTIRCYG